LPQAQDEYDGLHEPADFEPVDYLFRSVADRPAQDPKRDDPRLEAYVGCGRLDCVKEPAFREYGGTIVSVTNGAACFKG
jgi:hypothetical protein